MAVLPHAAPSVLANTGPREIPSLSDAGSRSFVTVLRPFAVVLGLFLVAIAASPFPELLQPSNSLEGLSFIDRTEEARPATEPASDPKVSAVVWQAPSTRGHIFLALTKQGSRAVSSTISIGLQPPKPSVPSTPESAPAAPDVPANQLLKTVIDKEVAADKTDQSLWMYTSDVKKPRSEIAQRVIETKQGILYLHISLDGQPLSQQQQKKEKERIRKLASNPDEPTRLERAQTEDGDKAQQMLALLPQAFVASYGEHRGDLIALNVSPNPQFRPTSHEAQVFLAMAGTVWVNPKENRLAEIDGHLLHKVEFGGGLLGHLDKGGEFHVVQTEVTPGHWEITRLRVEMVGKALFFKSIGEQQDETRSQYERMPDNLSLAQAAELLAR